ncbi:MAG TPA: hypothetical protein P5038_09635 [Candidatus Paceibacterota bacterium]|nr:hypothetical protein [Candidatus Paceibacterota bacterium]
MTLTVLLNLNPGEILLCQREDRLSVIERFEEDSPYAKANGNTAQILNEVDDARRFNHSPRIRHRIASALPIEVRW